MVDMVVPRRELREAVARVIRLYLDAAQQTQQTREAAPVSALDRLPAIVAAG